MKAREVVLADKEDGGSPTVRVTFTFCVTVTAAGALTVIAAAYEPAARPVRFAYT